MQTRNAARVLPDPVGAAISVWRPAAISRQPAACGSVGPGTGPRTRHARRDETTPARAPRYLRLPTFLPVTRHRDIARGSPGSAASRGTTGAAAVRLAL